MTCLDLCKKSGKYVGGFLPTTHSTTVKARHVVPAVSENTGWTSDVRKLPPLNPTGVFATFLTTGHSGNLRARTGTSGGISNPTSDPTAGS